VDYVVLELFNRKKSQNTSKCDVNNFGKTFLFCMGYLTILSVWKATYTALKDRGDDN
jgi:hypothetical protein